MPLTPTNTLDHMRGAVFFDGPTVRTKLTRFWVLLVLAAIIAAAGVVADSTATVIGAMIVAPLMTPIMGTMLGVVLGDRGNLLRSIGLVLAGAAAAIAIGYLIGLLSINEVVAATNPQVAGRVNPRLIDLLAALATGAVGSVALVRSDISDTLPGVAIAISLVPPLTVVGLTAESGAWSESAGALLLFTTNVAAILLTGTVVMALYGVHRAALAEAAPGTERVNRRNAVLVVIALFVLVAIPLTGASIRIGGDTLRESRVRSALTGWAEAGDWELVALSTRGGEVEVTAIGALPAPDLDDLRARLEAEGVDPADVDLNLVPREQIDLGDPEP
ncbi:MAG: DUF389 domain-containing protein [Ilumatobacteraceae bacterium]|nr:DUF389 domain-containing protein [Ilumatobacteraceae bacterium]